MPEPIPACSRGGAAAGPLPATTAGPSLTTSVYETHLGLAALTWSCTVLCLSLRIVLRPYADDDDEEEEELLLFRIRPWMLWKRRGTRRFHLKDHHCHHCMDFAWDLARVRFPPGGGLKPASSFCRCVDSIGSSGGARGLNSTDVESRCRGTSTTGSSSPRMKWPPAPPRVARRLNRDRPCSFSASRGKRKSRGIARRAMREREREVGPLCNIKKWDPLFNT
ncbi:hypothetical protein Cni_G10776 [Canna indica]|uniref:Uncharacterized protein n=1 Tax=Canna indica TaxID=4628 RepID=A0AAQ3K8H1_9LILI|nr:hypothetical protein Cni_G10776 [Canna indica]